MSIIGTFVATKEGGWAGSIRTLTIDVKARFVPNDKCDNEQAPAFRIFAGHAELGAAWRQRSDGENARDYLSVRLDDPSLAEPISAAMFFGAEGNDAQLVWSRRRKDS